MDEQPAEIQAEYQAWADSTRQCADPRCDGGVIVTGPYMASDGSPDWHGTPCGLCQIPIVTDADAECDDIPF